MLLRQGALIGGLAMTLLTLLVAIQYYTVSKGYRLSSTNGMVYTCINSCIVYNYKYKLKILSVL